jgi:DNA processing protein
LQNLHGFVDAPESARSPGVARTVHRANPAVASRGHAPDAVRRESAVTLSLLRRALDTRAQRHLRELLDAGADQLDAVGLIDKLAWALGIPAAERAARIGCAAEHARRALAWAARQAITLRCWFDADYPAQLAAIPDPPIVLWLRGRARLLGGPSVAVVGSRRATPTALAVARRLAAGLADAGFVVVSGMARGVDAAAHAAALETGGRTVAVLGSGPDVIYPREHEPLAARIVRAGLLASEFPPGTAPRAAHFPLRNRIISGLSRAVVVVEASRQSGSLITARAGLEQGREVMAVPGNVLSGRNEGSHALIKDGARLVETVTDVLEELGARGPGVGLGAETPANSLHPTGLEAVMAAGESYLIDELAAVTGRTVADLLAELGTLEASGRVQRLLGGSYIRLDEPAMDSRR